MPTDLPSTLLDYLAVWCGDLLDRLSDEDRAWLVDDVLLTYEGRPWPSRLTVQRLVEIIAGDVSATTVRGESLVLEGGIDAVVEALTEPSTRDQAIIDLGGMQPVAQLFAAVDAALRDGLLTARERGSVLSSSLRQPCLPDPIPDPAGRQPLPQGYPVGVHMNVIAPLPMGRPVPAMERYTPQRASLPAHAVASDPAPAWAPTRQLELGQDIVGREAQFHDGADKFLRARGWVSRRDLARGECERDEWTWPPSEEHPWWQPTIIDYDGSRFRVRLACGSLVEAPRTTMIDTFAQLRLEVEMIEAWSRREP